MEKKTYRNVFAEMGIDKTEIDKLYQGGYNEPNFGRCRDGTYEE